MPLSHDSNSKEAKIRILIIEDSAADIYVAVEMLTAAEDDYDVITAGTMMEARELVLANAFTLALLDLNLPDSRGVENVSTLLKWRSDLPVVVYSALSEYSDAKACIEAGAIDYIVKGRIDDWQLERTVKLAIDRHAMQARIEELHRHDGLTGLPNRQLFLEVLGYALEYAARKKQLMAVIYIGLDAFRAVNYTSVAAGDEVLTQIGRRLEEITRGKNAIARAGADEFVFLLESVDNTGGVEAFLKRARGALEAPVSYLKDEFNLTASIGVAMYPDAAVDADALLRAAETAMRIAKIDGRNRTVVAPRVDIDAGHQISGIRTGEM